MIFGRESGIIQLREADMMFYQESKNDGAIKLLWNICYRKENPRLWLVNLPCVFLVVYAYACWNIGSSVKDIIVRATQEYSGDRVEALIAYMQSEKHNLRNRNRSVWALGQIGDKRALSVLEKFHIGEPCDHNKYLCQYELKKAIDLCKGGLNLCSWVT